MGDADFAATLHLNRREKRGKERKFKLFLGWDSLCPTRQLMVAGMKHYLNRHRRRTLLPVPYSVRPDRLERGIRILRALRLSLDTPPVACMRPQQCEFEFALGKIR